VAKAVFCLLHILYHIIDIWYS